MLKNNLLRACAISAISCALTAQPARADEKHQENPGKTGNGDYTIGPDYKIDPDLTDQGNPKGRNFEFNLRLADSTIIRGDDPTLEPEKKPVREERTITLADTLVWMWRGYHPD